jgi:hypothetical protein
MMPKETVHMHLAQEVCRQIPSDSIFCEAIQHHVNLFLYGAVAPDTCFHYILGPCRSVVNPAGHIFHTTDASALVPILKFLNRFPGKDADALAFAAGLCCHIMADTWFHPLVYYFSGAEGLHDGSVARHRMFETALDLHCRAIIPESRHPEPFHCMAKQLEISDQRLTHLLQAVFCLDMPECVKYLRYAFKAHGFANALFASYTTYRLVRIFSALGFLKEYEVLFYPVRQPIRLDFFDRVLEFRHPVLETRYHETLASLSRKTVNSSLQLLSVVEDAMRTSTPPDQVISNAALPDIAPCLPETAAEFRCWHGDPDIRQKIYRNMIL